uniref:LAGLIDADG endonuclease n=1 Tax=Ramaria rubella TaxID=113071 RepID=UPI002238BE17
QELWKFLNLFYFFDIKLDLFLIILVLYFYSIFPYFFKLRLNPLNLDYFSTVWPLSTGNATAEKNILNNDRSVIPNNDTRIKGPKTHLVPIPNYNLKEIIFGLMLGDLTAERVSRNGNTRFRFYMSAVNRSYIYHLYFLFKLYVKTAPSLKVSKYPEIGAN